MLTFYAFTRITTIILVALAFVIVNICNKHGGGSKA
jgi:hypothetical protein